MLIPFVFLPFRIARHMKFYNMAGMRSVSSPSRKCHNVPKRILPSFLPSFLEASTYTRSCPAFGMRSSSMISCWNAILYHGGCLNVIPGHDRLPDGRHGPWPGRDPRAWSADCLLVSLRSSSHRERGEGQLLIGICSS